jgi:hypothetical protein
MALQVILVMKKNEAGERPKTSIADAPLDVQA